MCVQTKECACHTFSDETKHQGEFHTGCGGQDASIHRSFILSRSSHFVKRDNCENTSLLHSKLGVKVIQLIIDKCHCRNASQCSQSGVRLQVLESIQPVIKPGSILNGKLYDLGPDSPYQHALNCTINMIQLRISHACSD